MGNIPYIAQLCPLQYGPVVYKARALYTAVYNDLKVWCKGCGNVQQRGGRTTAAAGDAQQYTLYPNPNNGEMTIMQQTGDMGDAHVQVTDMLGRTVHNAELSFSGKTAQVKLNTVAPGMYTMKITDHKGINFVFKFIVGQ